MRRDRAWKFALALLAVLYGFFVLLPAVRGTKHDWNRMIEGAWSGRAGKAKVRMMFNSDKSCEILIREDETGDSQLVTGRYIFVTQTKPMSLTIRNSPELTHSLNTVVDFDGENVMKLAYFSPIKKTRPLSFLPQTTLVLKRE